jgi:amino acid transporter
VSLLGFSVSQAVSGFGVASYLSAIAPGLPPAPTAAVLVVIVTALGVLNIRINAVVTGLFLAVELAALLFVSLIGALHPHRDLLAAVIHPVVAQPNGLLAPASLALVGAAASGGIYAFNGYGAVVLLGEELHQARSRIVWVVFLALGVATLTELGPVVSILIGGGDLREILASPTPISTFVARAAGSTASKVLSVGVALAIFNAMIAVALMGGRQLYATGRDQLWPTGFNVAITRLHPRFGSPYIATIVLGVTALAGCFIDPRVLVLVLGNGNVALYFGLCLAVIVGRSTGTTAHAAFRTPLHPVIPVLCLLALCGVVWFDLHDEAGAKGLGATLVAMGVGLFYYVLVLRRRPTFSYRVPGLDGDAREEPGALS